MEQHGAVGSYILMEELNEMAWCSWILHIYGGIEWNGMVFSDLT